MIHQPPAKELSQLNPELVHQILERAAARWPDKVAIVCGEVRYTYREINDSSDALAASIHRL